MTIGEPWDTAGPASVAKKNKTSVISADGDDITPLDKTKFKIIACNTDGGDFLENHAYLFSEDGGTVVDLTELADHQHNGPANGGTLNYIYLNNPETFDLCLTRPIDFADSEWNNTTSGTGSLEFSNGGGSTKYYIRLRPNGTSGSGASISYTHSLSLSFAQASILSFRGNFETASSLAFHGGVNCDLVTAADSNTIKYQAEVCTATNNNWWLRTANGSANSASDIGVAISTSTTGVRLVHKPSGTAEVNMEIDAANQFVKTTNIPTSGVNTIGNIISFSIKNSTAADRPYRMSGCRLAFVTEDTWAYG